MLSNSNSIIVVQKVSNVEAKMTQTTSDLTDLQLQFLELKQNYEREIDVLRKAVEEPSGGA